MLSQPCSQLFPSRGGQLPSDKAGPIQTSAAQRPSGVRGPESPGGLWKVLEGWGLPAREDTCMIL